MNKKDKQFLQDRILEALGQTKEKSEKQRRGKLIQAGKELALLLVWLESMEFKTQDDPEECICSLINADESVLVKVFEYYHKAKAAPEIIRSLLTSFSIQLANGDLKVHFNWNTIPADKFSKAKELLAGH